MNKREVDVLRLGASLTLLALLATTAVADSWIYKDHMEIWRFGHGLRVDVVTDALSRYEAREYVKVTRNGKVLATINGAGFEILAASPKENVFVGISNSGLPGTAVVVFNKKGELLLFVRHGIARFDYCSESITVDRTWHGSKAKDIQFENEYDLSGISLLDCHGKRVNLLKTVAEAQMRGEKEHEEWKARQDSSKK